MTNCPECADQGQMTCFDQETVRECCYCFGIFTAGVSRRWALVVRFAETNMVHGSGSGSSALLANWMFFYMIPNLTKDGK